MKGLFDEFRAGTLVARNRIVRAATAESLATPFGKPTSALRAVYEELARGGVGTIVTGYAFVAPDGKPSEGALGICDDAFAQEYRELAGAVHAYGARIVLQLVYGGSKSKLAADDARRLASANMPCADGAPNVSILGPSALENPKTHLVPTQATACDLARVTSAFADAATRAKEWGFDGVEVHAAHGYLLSQFLGRRSNVREDAYGGQLRNRARLALECTAAVRKAVGQGYPVFVKINSCDDAQDPSGAHGGLGEDESAQVAAWLVQAGASAIEVSGDWHAASARAAKGEPFFAAFGARLARELDVPVVVTGGWRRLDVIEEHLSASGIAAIGMSRPLICEPDLPARWQAGRVTPSACAGCGRCAKRPGIPCALRSNE